MENKDVEIEKLQKENWKMMGMYQMAIEQYADHLAQHDMNTKPIKDPQTHSVFMEKHKNRLHEAIESECQKKIDKKHAFHMWCMKPLNKKPSQNNKLRAGECNPFDYESREDE